MPCSPFLRTRSPQLSHSLFSINWQRTKKTGINFTTKLFPFFRSFALPRSLTVFYLTKCVKYSQWITHCKRRTRMVNVSPQCSVSVDVVHTISVRPKLIDTMCFHSLSQLFEFVVHMCVINRASSFSTLEFIKWRHCVSLWNESKLTIGKLATKTAEQLLCRVIV